MKARHLVINSNKWFSAVTDYSLQLARFLDGHGGVIVCAHEFSPLLQKTKNYNLKRLVLPFIPFGLIAFLRCWLTLNKFLRSWNNDNNSSSKTVWVFEGREHSLCALHRLFRPTLWTNKRLVRVRGQAQPIRSNFINKNLYLNWTDKVVFAAAAVARLAPFYFSNKKATVQLYCAPQHDAQANRLTSFDFLPNVPEIDFAKPVFLVVGRYDPVKGHRELIDAFAETAFEQDVIQLVFIGETQNVKMDDLFQYAKKVLGEGVMVGNRALANDASQTKRLFMFDERVHNIREWMASAHFGVIPSLGSEVICRVAVEFLQAGTPVIASYIGALNEVLTGAPARVYSAQSRQQCVEALQWAVASTVQAATHKSMRAASRKKGEEFDSSQFEKLLEFIEQ